MAKRGINKHQKKAVENIMSDSKARTVREILDCWPVRGENSFTGKVLNRATQSEISYYLSVTRKDKYTNKRRREMEYFLDGNGELRMYPKEVRRYWLKKE